VNRELDAGDLNESISCLAPFARVPAHEAHERRGSAPRPGKGVVVELGRLMRGEAFGVAPDRRQRRRQPGAR
jgi:hypothetical protein